MRFDLFFAAMVVAAVIAAAGGAAPALAQSDVQAQAAQCRDVVFVYEDPERAGEAGQLGTPIPTDRVPEDATMLNLHCQEVWLGEDGAWYTTTIEPGEQSS